jgi:hypothetical protein
MIDAAQRFDLCLADSLEHDSAPCSPGELPDKVWGAPGLGPGVASREILGAP